MAIPTALYGGCSPIWFRDPCPLCRCPFRVCVPPKIITQGLSRIAPTRTPNFLGGPPWCATGIPNTRVPPKATHSARPQSLGARECFPRRAGHKLGAPAVLLSRSTLGLPRATIGGIFVSTRLRGPHLAPRVVVAHTLGRAHETRATFPPNPWAMPPTRQLSQTRKPHSGGLQPLLPTSVHNVGRAYSRQYMRSPHAT